MSRQISRRILIKQKTHERLEIDIYSPENTARKDIWLIILWFIFFTFSLFSGGMHIIWGLLSVFGIVFMLEESNKPVSHSMEFDALSDGLWINGGNSIGKKKIRISDIRSLSIYPTRKVSYGGAGAPGYRKDIYFYNLYGIIIQAEKNYRLAWELDESESISLINEIQRWLNRIK